MKKRDFLLCYVLAIVYIFSFAYLYEFAIEDHLSFSFLHGFQTAPGMETMAARWEYVLTVTLFSAVALVLPTILAYRMNVKLRAVQTQLDTTLTHLLSGSAGICCKCKKVHIQDEENKRESWEDIDRYITRRSDLKFIYGCCPECSINSK
jgi:hypothetical protein